MYMKMFPGVEKEFPRFPYGNCITQTAANKIYVDAEDSQKEIENAENVLFGAVYTSSSTVSNHFPLRNVEENTAPSVAFRFENVENNFLALLDNAYKTLKMSTIRSLKVPNIWTYEISIIFKISIAKMFVVFLFRQIKRNSGVV